MRDDKHTRSRLIWRCRRGIREMDVLLQRFLETDYESLGRAERAAFERMLDEPDPDLFAWITGRSVPDNPQYASLIRYLSKQQQ